MFSQSLRSICLIIACSTVLAGCGGREAKPISVTNHTDSSLDCASVEREFNANERQIISTAEERQNAQAKNAILTATGVVLFFPALFFIDPKSPERVEIDALRNRNNVLVDLAKSKKCRVPASQLAELYKRIDNPSPQMEK